MASGMDKVRLICDCTLMQSSVDDFDKIVQP
jgi:hypothetical protein